MPHSMILIINMNPWKHCFLLLFGIHAFYNKSWPSYSSWAPVWSQSSVRYPFILLPLRWVPPEPSYPFLWKKVAEKNKNNTLHLSSPCPSLSEREPYVDNLAYDDVITETNLLKSRALKEDTSLEYDDGRAYVHISATF